MTGFVVDDVDEAVDGHRRAPGAAAGRLPRVLRAALHGAAHGRGLRGGLRGADGEDAPGGAAGRTPRGLAAIERGRGRRARAITPATGLTDGRMAQPSNRSSTTSWSTCTTSSTSWRRRRAPTIARACSSTARRSRCSIASATSSRSASASRASTTTAPASCRGWSCGIGGRRPLLLSSTVKQENDLLTVDLANPDLKDETGQIVLPRGHAARVPHASSSGGACCYERLRVSNFGPRASRPS